MIVSPFGLNKLSLFFIFTRFRVQKPVKIPLIKGLFRYLRNKTGAPVF